MSSPSSISTSYQAALDQAAYYVVPRPGVVRFSGETRREYLQRQTTNDIDLLSPSSALPTLLTSPAGRILEYFILLDEGDDITMLTQPGHGPGVAAYFQKRVFFNDRIAIRDLSDQWAQVDLHGPRAAETLTALGFPVPSELDAMTRGDLQGQQITILARPGLSRPSSYLLLIPFANFDYLINRLTALSVPALDLPSRESLRIESGLAGDPDFHNEYTPFELSLDQLVSTEKGCYTGQEVLARQVTYDKVVRRLVTLRTSAPVPPGAALFVDGKPAGSITSTAHSPRFGSIALAGLRKPLDQPGTQLLTAEGISALVSTLF